MMIPPDPRAPARCWRAVRAPTFFALCAMATAALADDAPRLADPVPSGVSLVTQHVIAGGGVSRARSACFDLDGTVAEPVAGPAQGGAFTLNAGFLAMPVATDSLFRNSFEVCQP
jgi:hypothetical protein